MLMLTLTSEGFILAERGVSFLYAGDFISISNEKEVDDGRRRKN